MRKLQLERLEPRALLSGVPLDWLPRGAGGGGALFSPQLSPHSASDLFIASDMGQLFHSRSAGASWETVDFHEIQARPPTQVQFTNDPNILYSLDTTEIDGGESARVTKSTNGGQTWNVLPANPLGDDPAIKLFADPNSSQRLIVSDFSRLFFSADGGVTFSQKFSTTDSNLGLHVGGVFFEGTSIYVGTSKGLLVSTNGGQTFGVSSVVGLPSGEAILGFAGGKQNGVTQLFAITRPAADVYAGIQGTDYGPAKVFSLIWGQGSWTQRTLPADVYPFFVAMAGNTASTAYLAGSSSDSLPTVYKTSDGGVSWQNVFRTADNENIATGWAGDSGDLNWTWNEAVLGLAVATNNANRLVITDYGFAHASSNGGASWQQLYVNPADQNPAGAETPEGRAYRSSGLDNTSSWNIAWTSPANLIVSSTDIKGMVSRDGGLSFSFDYTGHDRNTMYHSVVHPVSGIVYAATSSVHDLYQSTYLEDERIDGGNGAVLYSADGAHNWQTLHDFGRPVVWVATDPTSPNRLYAAVVHRTQGGIYVSNNIQQGAASSWTKLANPPRTEGHPFNIRVLSDGTLVASYSGRRANDAFTASSGVFVSTNGGQSWLDRSDAGMRYWTKDVVIDPHDAAQNTWYAGVYSGWGGPPNGLGGLYRTTNRGLTWTRISALDRVESITVNPTDPHEAFVTTERDGLMYTANLRATAPSFTQVDSYPFRQTQRVFYNPYDLQEIWVTSFGAGLRVGRAEIVAPRTIEREPPRDQQAPVRPPARAR